MNIKIHSKNFEITPAIDEYVMKKISSLEKFLDGKDGSLCEVEVGKTSEHHKSGDIYKAEVNIMEPGNKQVYVVAEEFDLYAAIDKVRDEAERAIVSRKNKRNTLFKRGGAAVKGFLKKLDIRRRK